MEHSFDIEIAKEYGIQCAIILKNIYFWIEKNKANDKHLHDGKYWTYNSIKAMTELFPYMSKNTINRALSKLEEEGLIITGNFNGIAYDRTKWYALTDLGYCVCEKAEIDLPKVRNGKTQSQKPIPYINTNDKPNNKTLYVEETFDVCHPKDDEYPKDALRPQDVDGFFEEIWKLYPNKKGKGAVSKTKKQVLFRIGKDQMIRCINRYIHEHDELKQSGRFCPEWKNGSTFFNSGYVDYLDENYADKSQDVEEVGDNPWQ